MYPKSLVPVTCHLSTVVTAFRSKVLFLSAKEFRFWQTINRLAIAHRGSTVSRQSVITRIQTRDDRPRREISGSCCPVQTTVVPNRGSTPSNFTHFWGSLYRLIYLCDFCVRLFYPSAGDIRLLYLQVGAVRLFYPSSAEDTRLLYLLL